MKCCKQPKEKKKEEVNWNELPENELWMWAHEW